MKTITKATFTLLTMLAISFTANAYDFMVDGLCYNITSDNTVEVTFMRDPHPEYWQFLPAYYDLYGDITIPEFIVCEDKLYYVKGIGNYAFTLCSQISGVDIPNTVTSIGYYSFFDCDKLSNITLPNSINRIGGHSFQNSEKIMNITIPNSVIEIGEFAFSNCRDLKSVIAPCTFDICGQNIFASTHISNLTLTGNVLSDERAFVNLSECAIDTLNIGCGITSLGDFWVSPIAINCYAETPPTCMNYTFASYEGELHVPATSTAAYFTAEFWQNFENFNADLTDKVILNKTNAGLIQWETITLSTTTIPENSKILWSTTDPSVATVDENGVVTALKEGECDIFATIASNYAVYASCHISVSYPEITLSLSKESLEMNVGDEQTLTATIIPDNTGLTPTWSSSNESVATVEDGVVSAIGEGECDITAKVLDKTATCHITVSGNVTLSLNIDNAILGANQILTVYPACTPDVPVELIVTSSDPSVVLARVVNRTNASAQGFMSFPEKDMAMNLMEQLSASDETKAPALASEKAIMIVGVQNGTATITVSTSDGKATPAILELRVVDINDDRVVDIDDLNICINIILGINNDPVAAEHADLNGDGVVDVADLNIIINIILMKYPKSFVPNFQSSF